METATPTGVDEVVVIDPRKDAMAEVIKNANDLRDKEIREAGGEVVDTSKAPNLPDPDNPIEEKPEEKAEEKKEEKVEEKEEKVLDLVTIKVDGKEKQVPRSEIEEFGRRAMQKELAADSRLEQANKLLKEAEEKLAQVSKDPEKRLSDDDVAQARALQVGTEDEAAEVLRTLKKAAPDQDQIIAMAEVRAVNRIEFNQVRKDYADILDDPYLAQIAVMEDEVLLKSGDKRSPAERLPDIAKKIREWRGEKTAPVESMQDKKDLKATITNLPSASTRKPAPEQPKPRSASDVIEQMRKDREGRQVRS